MKLFYQYMAIVFDFSSTLSDFHPLQVENSYSNSRLVLDEDYHDKFRLERVKSATSRFTKSQISQIHSFSVTLKLWIAVARHNFKWLKMSI